MSNFAEEIFAKYPFLSLVVYGGNEYIGIIQNYDDHVLSLYDFAKLKEYTEKQEFLDLGEVWWGESNRQIPINLFLKHDWHQFGFTLVNLNAKDCEIRFGPSVSIQELAKKRSKRRNIQLVRKIK